MVIFNLTCLNQVLICTATLAWGVNFPAHLVVIKGTEYYDGKQKRYVDMPITTVLQMMGRAGRPQVNFKLVPTRAHTRTFTDSYTRACTWTLTQKTLRVYKCISYLSKKYFCN